MRIRDVRRYIRIVEPNCGHEIRILSWGVLPKFRKVRIEAQYWVHQDDRQEAPTKGRYMEMDSILWPFEESVTYSKLKEHHSLEGKGTSSASLSSEKQTNRNRPGCQQTAYRTADWRGSTAMHQRVFRESPTLASSCSNDECGPQLSCCYIRTERLSQTLDHTELFRNSRVNGIAFRF